MRDDHIVALVDRLQDQINLRDKQFATLCQVLIDKKLVTSEELLKQYSVK